MMKQLRLQAYGGDSAAQFALARYCEDIGDVEQSIFWYRAAMQNGSLEALEKCEDLGIDCDPPKESLKDLKCRIYPVGYLENYMFTAVCTNLGGKWILSMHEERDTWETQGGHIEAGEDPLECARRELFEESGIKDADVYPVCDYWGFDSNGCANGIVFLAVAKSLGELPESEMKAVRAFDTLPENLTYPQVTPRFFKEAEELFRKL